MFTSSEAVKVKAVVMNKLVGRGNVDMENRCAGKKYERGSINSLHVKFLFKTYFDILFAMTVVVKLLVILQMLCCGNLLL